MLDFAVKYQSYIDLVTSGGVKRAEGIAAYFGAENLIPLTERISQLEKRLAVLGRQKWLWLNPDNQLMAGHMKPAISWTWLSALYRLVLG